MITYYGIITLDTNRFSQIYWWPSLQLFRFILLQISFGFPAKWNWLEMEKSLSILHRAVFPLVSIFWYHSFNLLLIFNLHFLLVPYILFCLHIPSYIECNLIPTSILRIALWKLFSHSTLYDGGSAIELSPTKLVRFPAGAQSQSRYGRLLLIS